MNRLEMRIPKLGASVESVQLIRFTKNVGDFVAQDETIAEVLTDKVDAEIPAVASGTIVDYRFSPGDDVPVGAVFAILELGERDAMTIQGKKSQFLSPLVRAIIKKENISASLLEEISGTGRGGRVSKNDLLHFLKNQRRREFSEPTPEISHPEILEMTQMRKIIAQRMKKSVQTSPHVTAYIESDVTDLAKWRLQHRDDFFNKHGEKLTLTPLFVYAVARAIRDFPRINVSVDETETKILQHDSIHLGVATELPDGNLIVPVIRNADRFSVYELAMKLNDLVHRARKQKLTPDEARGSTFTISNIGTFGNLMGTPIINQPEVAILATGAIKKKPAVLETEDGDIFAVRQFMYLSLSFDHRVVDGSLGGVFLTRVGEYLEKWKHLDLDLDL